MSRLGYKSKRCKIPKSVREKTSVNSFKAAYDKWKETS